ALAAWMCKRRYGRQARRPAPRATCATGRLVRSKIQLQRLALAAAHAHHHRVAGALALRQDGVAMVGLTFEHSRLAGAANPISATVAHVDPRFQQSLEDGLVQRDGDHAIAAREMDGEAA